MTPTPRSGTKAAPKHPAKFSNGIVEIAADWIRKHDPYGHHGDGRVHVLDPFAGVGGVHRLRAMVDVVTTGIEIEEVWASAHPDTIVGDALDLPYPFSDGFFDVIFTSPTYANRLADKHKVGGGKGEAKPWVRRSYTHDLREATGDPEATLHPNNSGTMQWGDHYKRFHTRFIVGANRALCDRGLFMLNVSNHVRNGRVVDVCEWWEHLMVDNGYKCIEREEVPTPRLRYGKNHEARVSHEMIYCWKRGTRP